MDHGEASHVSAPPHIPYAQTAGPELSVSERGSEIRAGPVEKRLSTHGALALTGRLPSQDADHVKDVAGRVKDVKSVDASAMIPASPQRLRKPGRATRIDRCVRPRT